MPHLRKGGSGAGALMEPITKLLKSKANDQEWIPALRGSLRSAIAGRQYPQARVYAAGWAEHNKCLFCLQRLAGAHTATARRLRISGKTKQEEVVRRNKVRHKVVATAEQIAQAPVGNLLHRLRKCTSAGMSDLRDKWAPCDIVTMTQ